MAGPGTQLFERRPEYAPYISMIISQWSYNEANLCSILAYLLSANAGPVMDMVYTLNSTGVQLDMIEAAAERQLFDPELELFQAVLYLARKCAKKRHRVAHHVWAYSDDLPNALILIDPSAYVEVFVKLQIPRDISDTSFLQRMSQEIAKLAQAGEHYDLDRCFVYRENDLKAVIDEMAIVSRCTTLLINYLNPSHAARDQIYSLLALQPGIDAALSNVRKNRPRKPIPQPPLE